MLAGLFGGSTLSKFIELFAGNPILAVVSLLILIVLIWLFVRDSFFATDISYRLPLIGKLSRYSKDLSETTRGSWLHSEANLCHDYSRHVMCLSKTEFEQHTEYLRKCYDHGRKPMPWWVLVRLILLGSGLIKLLALCCYD